VGVAIAASRGLKSAPLRAIFNEANNWQRINAHEFNATIAKLLKSSH